MTIPFGIRMYFPEMEMTNSLDRFDRNIRLFGAEGQRKIRETRVAVIGVGGLGTHVVQQLALLGVRRTSHFGRPDAILFLSSSCTKSIA